MGSDHSDHVQGNNHEGADGVADITDKRARAPGDTSTNPRAVCISKDHAT